MQKNSHKLSSKETDTVIKNPKKTSSQDSFIGKVLKSFHRIDYPNFMYKTGVISSRQKREKSSNSSYKANITWFKKKKSCLTRKENYKPVSLRIVDARILNTTKLCLS